MDLKEFVSKTLIEITEGVISAQNFLTDKGAIVVPAELFIPGSAQIRPGGWAGRSIQMVQFKVALAVQENTEGKGGIGVVAGLFKVGVEGGSNSMNESSNSVEFSVPIAFPEGNSPKSKMSMDPSVR